MPSVSSQSLLLSIATEKISRETDRADAAERKCARLASQLRSVCEQRESLQHQLDKAQSELGLYRIQLDLAQKEINRAEEVVAQVDRARLKAEEQAARNRSKVRQLIERAAVNDALQQGRESGFREGLERGKILALSEMMLARHNGRSRQTASHSSTTSVATTRHSATSQPRRVETPDNVPSVRPPSAASRRAHSSSPVSTRQRSSSIKAPRPVPASSIAPRNQYHIPPDGFIPTINPDSVISLPPPHELSRPISAGHPPTQGPDTNARARSRGARSGRDATQRTAPVIPEESTQRPTSPASTESRSTTISHFEFVRTPHEHSNNDDATGQSMLLPELPSSLLHIHQLPSPTNSPAIYHRPLRDEFETEQSTPINEQIHLVSQQNGDNNIGIDVESASASPTGSTSFTTNTELGLLTPNPHAQPPSQAAPSEPIVLSTSELPPGFVPL
ncbi:hypothetical protein M378DRAFT_196389 [Amanita muscaria Koide BX008]|uniref:Uncharacterized protein n=1 Tax=Amanita muscaria (strain Koide BX008) TaxID=946122 RepID=A0A0C2TML7_AMAMK|nr:hypothetical protein M378DRAFT_196389 [Amanita muscaria Koide BX008]